VHKLNIDLLKLALVNVIEKSECWSRNLFLDIVLKQNQIIPVFAPPVIGSVSGIIPLIG
jgi:hypothetical protein